MGTVYLGQSADGTLVAVKVIRSDLAADHGFLARFRQEVEAARRVAPFCTARVLDANLDNQQPYLVTEFVDGVRLDTLVQRDGPLPLSSLQGVAVGVAAALAAIHAVGLVHRDLKPNNVLLSYFGPRVIDFGIARALDAATSLTGAGTVVGTPGWMAPEQVAGRSVTPAADVFVWGTMVAYAGMGRSPFGEGATEVLAQRIMHQPPELGGLPDSLQRVVQAAMTKDPVQRPSAQRLVLDLAGGGAPGDPQHAVTEVLQRTWVLPALATEKVRSVQPPPGPPAAPTRPPGSPGGRVPRAAVGRPSPTAAPGTQEGRRPDQGSAPPPRRPQGPAREGPAARQDPHAAPAKVERAPAPPPAAPASSGGWPAPSAPVRRGGRSRTRKRVLIALVFVLLVLLGIARSQGTPGQEQAGPSSEPAVSPPPGVGEPARDGAFEFVVQEVDCGSQTIGNDIFNREADGQYCLVGLRVTNIGSQSSRLNDGNQRLYDADGKEYRVLSEARFYLFGSGETLWDEVNPGNTVSGSLVYDVPDHFRPFTIHLKESQLSAGIAVRL